MTVRLLSFLIVFAAATSALGQRPKPPNVIVILTDDQGFGDVGINGNDKIKTPTFDRFASEGVRFTRFYCEQVCAPTRASLLTGRYFYRTGVIHTSRGGAKMHNDETTLAELLTDARYATGIFGKWHLGDNYPMRPQDQGFSEVLVHRSGGITQTPDVPNSYFNPILWRNGQRTRGKGYCTDVFFNAALEFIEQNQDWPFFVYLPTNAPHTPLEVSDKYAQPYRDLGLDDNTARVYGMVANIDENLAKLLAKLDALKLRENTLIVILGDNGPQQKRYVAGLRGRKGTSYEGGIRVPCFLQWPATVKGPKVIDTPLAHIDLLPTILAACGVEAPADLKLDGKNFLPVLKGETAGFDDRMLFFQCHRGLQPERGHNAAVVTKKWKLVSSGSTFSKEKLEGKPEIELFELAADAGEQKNLAAEQPERVAAMQAAYNKWFDDVKSTRQFTPGVIQLGSNIAPDQHLCRYQDATFKDGQPAGWSVEVAQTGQYELNLVRGDIKGPGELHVVWANKEFVAPLSATTSSAVVNLAAGKGTLDIWFQTPDGKRAEKVDNPTTGDVHVRLVP